MLMNLLQRLSNIAIYKCKEYRKQREQEWKAMLGISSKKEMVAATLIMEVIWLVQMSIADCMIQI